MKYVRWFVLALVILSASRAVPARRRDPAHPGQHRYEALDQSAYMELCAQTLRIRLYLWANATGCRSSHPQHGRTRKGCLRRHSCAVVAQCGPLVPPSRRVVGHLSAAAVRPWRGQPPGDHGIYPVRVQGPCFQGELLYYTLSFAGSGRSRLPPAHAPGWAMAGIVMALAQYTKASALPGLALFLGIALLSAVCELRGQSSSPAAVAARDPAPARHRRCRAVSVHLFLLLMSPYLIHSKQQYGRFFL